MKISHRLLCALLLPLSACGRAMADDSPAAGAPEWRLSPQPVVSIGVADGAPEYQLHHVAGATRLADGSIAVLNAGSASWSLYDRQGRFVVAAGRKGQGPGEFEAPNWLGRLPGDTVVVWDQRLARLSFFRPDGALARVVTASGTQGMFPRAVGMFADGSLALEPGPDIFAMMRGGEGIRRDTAQLHRLARDGSRADPLVRFAGSEVHVSDREGGFSWNDAPFGRQGFPVAAGDRLYVGDSGSGQISIYSLAGERVRTVPSPHTAWRVEPADVEKYREERLAPIEDPNRRREMVATLEGAPTPDVAPSFGALLVDGEGNLWVQAYPRPSAPDVAWAVLAPDGSPLGRLQAPRGLRVMEVGRDYLLGVRHDDLGVERLEMYSFTRAED